MSEEFKCIYFDDRWEEEQNDHDLDDLDQVVVVFGEHKELIAQLKEGYQVVQVQWGEAFRKLEADRYEIDPSRLEQYQMLLQTLLLDGIVPHRVIYNGYDQTEGLEQLLNTSVYYLFYVIKAISIEMPKERIRMIILNQYREEIQTAFRQALNGLAKTINKEYKKYFVKVVQVQKEVKDWCGLIAYEFADLGEEICYIEDKRYVRLLRSCDIHGESYEKLPYRKEGVYLITGGMGKLGVLVAQNLATNYQAKLVLVGRSALDEDKEEVISKINELGGQALYIQGDISDAKDAERIVHKTKKAFGSIQGVFHCAGAIKDHLIEDKTLEEIKMVVPVKVKGAIYLDTSLKEEKLDFFVMFASVSYLGNAGQLDYAYANCFLNKFAEHRNRLEAKNQRHGKALCINWPYWAEGGMSIRPEILKLLQRRIGCVPLPTELGMKALEEVMSSSREHVLVQYGEVEKLNKYKETVGHVKR